MAVNREKLRILVVGAHPADVFDQSGGTMLLHARDGDWVGCVVVTHGARVHDVVLSDEMFHAEKVPDAEELERIIVQRGDVRAAEVAKVCKALGGAYLRFLGADDAVLLPVEKHIRELARIYREVRPNVLITHFPREDGGYGPHAATGEIALRAAEFAGAVDPGDTNPPLRLAQIFYFGMGACAVRQGVFGGDGGFTNNVFIDIGGVIEEKFKAVNQLESQGYNGAYARKCMEYGDGSHGNAGGVSYAESFIMHASMTCSRLPVSDMNLQFTRESNMENLARRSVMKGFQ